MERTGAALKVGNPKETEKRKKYSTSTAKKRSCRLVFISNRKKCLNHVGREVLAVFGGDGGAGDLIMPYAKVMPRP